MFKQGQQADVTVAFDSLEKSHVSVAWVQFYVIIKDIRDRSTAEQQVDQLLVTEGKNRGIRMLTEGQICSPPLHSCHTWVQ